MASGEKVGRRAFIQATGAAVLGAGCGAGDDPEPASGPRYPAVPVPEGESAVAVVRREAVDDAVAKAVALAGGLDAIRAGDRVFVKINAVHGATGGLRAIVTAFDMIDAVVGAVRRQAPGVHVTVGDRSFYQGSSQSVFQTSGLGQAALDAGADEVFPAPQPKSAPEEWLLLQPPGYQEVWQAGGGILCLRRIVEADHLIDVAVCKNHELCAFSLSLKNFVGAIGDESRQLMHDHASDPPALAAAIAILNGAFDPALSIVDARDALVNGGPDGVSNNRVQTSPGLVLASRDRVALDAAAASLLQLELSRTEVPEPDDAYPLLTGTPAWSLPQIAAAGARAIGAGSATKVALRFDDVPDGTAIEALFRAT